MPLPEKFHGSAKPNESSELSKSLAANRVSPSSITMEGKETAFLYWVCNCTDQYDLVIQVLKELGIEKGLCSNEWQERDRLVLHRGKSYVPHNGQLRLNIVKAHHYYPIAGHSG